jgi:hypothetical protein
MSSVARTLVYFLGLALILSQFFLALKADAFFFKKDLTPVNIINNPDCPLKIYSAKIKDKGTKELKIKGVEESFISKVKNKSDKTILSYQILWTRSLPFDNFETKNIWANSIKPLKAHKKQTLMLRKPSHFRADAYYDIQITKILYEDKEIWDSGIDEKGQRWEEIRKEIEGEKEATEKVPEQKLIGP